MPKTPLIGSALIVLLAGLSTAAAQRGTSYDWNELSPSQADLMAQQRIGGNTANAPVNTMRHAAGGGVSTPSKPSNAGVARGGDPPSEVSLSSNQKSTIFRGAIAQPQPPPSDFRASTGAIVPQSLSLFAFDDRVQSLVAAAKKYDYVRLPGNDVLLVDPSSRKVVAMIEQKDATGNK